MPAFICERCGCWDNSACGGTYWSRRSHTFPPPYAGELLCCVCAPLKHNDGSANEGAGRWHNRFPRVNEAGQTVTLPPPAPTAT